MRIGIVAQYLDSRNDIRDFIISLSQKAHVCVYLNKKDLHLSKLLPDVEIRQINVSIPKNIRNHFFRYLYMGFGRIPKSKTNYFYTELRKLKHANISTKTVIERRTALFFTKYFPSLLSYDDYLNNVNFKKKTEIADMDVFLAFTEIYDDLLMAQL